MITVQRVTWLGACAELLVDQKLYVVQWSCKILTALAHCGGPVKMDRLTNQTLHNEWGLGSNCNALMLFLFFAWAPFGVLRKYI